MIVKRLGSLYGWLLAAAILVMIVHQTCAQLEERGCRHGLVRLVDGMMVTISEGRVEVCVNNIWGTITFSDGFEQEAQVLCRQLGHEVPEDVTIPADAQFPSPYGNATGPVWLEGVNCIGTEASILECPRSFDIGYTTNDHTQDAAINCTLGSCMEGDIRLSGGAFLDEGMVEMCVNGIFVLLVEYVSWTYQNSFVVCRQLELPPSAVRFTSLNIADYPLPPKPVYSMQPLCFGNESSLADCGFAAVDGLFITGTVIIRCDGILDTCSPDGAVRLVNGPSSMEGRVEYCSNGVWGTVSSNGFDSFSLEVVCRSMPAASTYTDGFIFKDAHFGEGTGPIVFSMLECTGNESDLVNCSSEGPQGLEREEHSSDVGVSCIKPFMDGCSHGDVRIANGSIAGEGRVEVCLNGEWGTVCGNSFTRTTARVVCRQAGFLAEIGFTVLDVGHFGQGDRPTVVENINCVGNESDFLSCSSIDERVECDFGDTAAVHCAESTGCEDGLVQLVGGTAGNEGIVIYCNNGVWVTPSNTNDPLSEWDAPEAQVVCDDLAMGFSDIEVGYTVQDGIFEQSSIYPTSVNGVSCEGAESSLKECEVINIDTLPVLLPAPVGVQCAPVFPGGCSDGDMRLIDGVTKYDGVVEVCRNDVWGLITSDADFNQTEARNICYQLGLPNEFAFGAPTSPFSYQNRRHHYSKYTCDEITLACTLIPYDSQNASQWRMKEAVGVKCSGPSISDPCSSDGDVRLVGGAIEREGRVELCLDGYWGNVCGMDDLAALFSYVNVVCNQLGYPTIYPRMILSDEVFGRNSGPTYTLSSMFSCSGVEASLADCSEVNTNIDVGLCPRGEILGALCQDNDPVSSTISIQVTPNSTTLDSTLKVECDIDPLPTGIENTDESLSHRVSFVAPFLAGLLIQSNSMFSSILLLEIGVNGIPRKLRVFCIPLLETPSNEFGLFGVSDSVEVRIRGLLEPAQNEVVLTNSNLLILTVVRTTDTLLPAIEYVRDLSWYHNGIKISPDSRRRFSENNMTLTVSPANALDIGIYEALFDGISVYPFDQYCQTEVLKLVRLYPIMSPATFIIYSTDDELQDLSEQQQQAENRAILQPRRQVLNFDSNSHREVKLTITINGLSSALQPHVTATLSHAGISPPAYSNIPIEIQDRPSGPVIVLEFKEISYFAAGEYDVTLFLKLEDYIVNELLCSKNYFHFAASAIGNLEDLMVLDNAVVEISYTEPPVIVVSSSNSLSITQMQNTTLRCAVSEGFPQLYNVSWIKNAQVLANSDEKELTYIVPSMQAMRYGRYECVYNNSALEYREELTLQERASFLLQFFTSETCSDVENEEFTQALKISVANLWSTACSCSFMTDLLTNLTVTCTNGGRISYAGDIIFSSDDGGVTASTLIDQLQDYILSVDQLIVPVEGYDPLTINSNCPIKQQDYYNIENSACSESNQLDAVYIALIVVTIVLILLLVISIVSVTALLCCRRRKKENSISMTQPEYDLIRDSPTVSTPSVKKNQFTAGQLPAISQEMATFSDQGMQTHPFPLPDKSEEIPCEQSPVQQGSTPQQTTSSVYINTATSDVDTDEKYSYIKMYSRVEREQKESVSTNVTQDLPLTNKTPTSESDSNKEYMECNTAYMHT